MKSKHFRKYIHNTKRSHRHKDELEPYLKIWQMISLFVANNQLACWSQTLVVGLMQSTNLTWPIDDKFSRNKVDGSHYIFFSLYLYLVQTLQTTGLTIYTTQIRWQKLQNLFCLKYWYYLKSEDIDTYIVKWSSLRLELVTLWIVPKWFQQIKKYDNEFIFEVQTIDTLCKLKILEQKKMGITKAWACNP